MSKNINRITGVLLFAAVFCTLVVVGLATHRVQAQVIRAHMPRPPIPRELLEFAESCKRAEPPQNFEACEFAAHWVAAQPETAVDAFVDTSVPIK